jgi:mediator of RNA polymerase II transcription subunit 31
MLLSVNRFLRMVPDEENRFVVELEFVQCLANPAYVNYLSQQGYFKDPLFISYLSYLQYWRNPPYLYHIQYPHCFVYLDMILGGDTVFREQVAPRHETMMYWHEQQYLLWKHGRKYHHV